MDRNQNKIIQNLTILNWNANGINNQRSLFIAFLARYNVDIACISETHLDEVTKFRIPGYNVYRKDRCSEVAAGGVAVIIKSKYEHIQLPELPDLKIEMTSIKVKLDDQSSVVITSAYRQPKIKLVAEDIKRIFDTTESTLIIGDVNSKNTLWGCRVSNPEGIKLENLAIANSFQILAPDDYTYYPYREDRKSVV